jgi:hypothetical protein
MGEQAAVAGPEHRRSGRSVPCRAPGAEWPSPHHPKRAAGGRAVRGTIGHRRARWGRMSRCALGAVDRFGWRRRSPTDATTGAPRACLLPLPVAPSVLRRAVLRGAAAATGALPGSLATTVAGHRRLQTATTGAPRRAAVTAGPTTVGDTAAAATTRTVAVTSVVTTAAVTVRRTATVTSGPPRPRLRPLGTGIVVGIAAATRVAMTAAASAVATSVVTTAVRTVAVTVRRTVTVTVVVVVALVFVFVWGSSSVFGRSKQWEWGSRRVPAS